MIDTIHIAVCMKPIEGNFAQNAIEHGVAGLNVDGCRIESGGEHKRGHVTKQTTVSGDMRTGKALGMYGAGSSFVATDHAGGRWPANVIHDGSDKVEAEFSKFGVRESNKQMKKRPHPERAFDKSEFIDEYVPGYGDKGTASRFFKECHQDDD